MPSKTDKGDGACNDEQCHADDIAGLLHGRFKRCRRHFQDGRQIILQQDIANGTNRDHFGNRLRDFDKALHAKHAF